MTRVARAAGKCRSAAVRRRLSRCRFAAESFEVVLLVAVLEHTREPWRLLAEARRVLKPGGRAVIVVPNDVDDERRTAAARQVSDSLSRSPDLHDAGRMRAWLRDGFRIARGFHAAVPRAAVCREPLLLRRRRRRERRRCAEAERSSCSAPGPAGMSAAWRLSELGYTVTVLERDARRRRHGQDDHGRQLCRRLRPAHLPHPRDRRRAARIHDAIQPFFGDDPLILTRGTRVLLRGKEYVYPLEMLQVLTGVSPLLSARIMFDYAVATIEVDAGAAEERTLVRGVGRPQPRAHALRPVLRHLFGARLGAADVADFVEAGAARREAESEERHPAHARASRPIRRPTSRSTCIRARASACSSRTWPPQCAKRGNCVLLESPVVRLEREGDRIARVVYHAGRARGDDRVRRRAVDAAAAAARRA